MTFREFIESLGLRPGVIEPGAKWKRCPTNDHPKKRNGSYRLAADGMVGWAVNYATMTDVATWRAEGAADVPAFDPRALNEARQQQRRDLIAATRAAREFYDACAPLRNSHAYLESHGLDMTGAYGLRVDRDGWIVVPAYRGGSVATVQRISPEGVKRYWPGASKAGASYLVDRPMAAITVLCEGLATGLAVFAAFHMARVVVCFDTGNMTTVAQTLPPGMTCIAADNDHQTICQRHRDEGLQQPYDPWEQRPEWCKCNPGRCAATEAAEAIGCGVALPYDMPDKATDWCDWRNARVAERMEAWNRRPHVTDAAIRRAVDAQLAVEIQRAARFRAPPMQAEA